MEATACAEMWEILEQLSTEVRKKIPRDIINVINVNRDKRYNANINLDIPLEEQNICEQTVNMLCYINLAYLATPGEEEKLIKIYRENEERLTQEYDVYKKFDERKTTTDSNELPVEVKPKKWYEKIFEKIRNLFVK